MGAYPWGEPGTVLENSDGPEDWACELMNRIRDQARDQALAMDFHHWALARHADQVHDHLRADGGVLVVRVPNDQEQQAEKHARLAGVAHSPRLPEAMRWSVWTHYTAEAMLRHVREAIFPWLRTLGAAGSSFERYMQNAEFKINKPSLLVEACKLIDQMQIANHNQDVQGGL